MFLANTYVFASLYHLAGYVVPQSQLASDFFSGAFYFRIGVILLIVAGAVMFLPEKDKRFRLHPVHDSVLDAKMSHPMSRQFRCVRRKETANLAGKHLHLGRMKNLANRKPIAKFNHAIILELFFILPQKRL